jgi:hypothetical protein
MGGQVGLGAGKQARHDPEVEQDRAGPRPVNTDHSRPNYTKTLFRPRSIDFFFCLQLQLHCFEDLILPSHPTSFFLHRQNNW